MHPFWSLLLFTALLFAGGCSGGGGGGSSSNSNTTPPTPADKLTLLDVAWTPDVPVIEGNMTVTFKVRNDAATAVRDIATTVAISQELVGTLDAKTAILAGDLAAGATSATLSVTLKVKMITKPPANFTRPGKTELLLDSEGRDAANVLVKGGQAEDFTVADSI